MLKLTLEAFRGFERERIFEFPRGVNLIEGKNGAGKSTIVQAIQYALFGSSVLPYNVANIQNLNTRKPFKVNLRYKDLNIDRYADVAYFGEISGHNAVTNAVEKYLSINKDQFKIANCINQGELNYFTSLRPAERVKYIEKLFNLTSLKQAVKDIHSDLKQLKSELKQAEEHYNQLKEVVENYRPSKTKEEINKLKEEIQAKLDRLEEERKIYEHKDKLLKQLGDYIYTPLPISPDEYASKYAEVKRLEQIKEKYEEAKQSFNTKEYEMLKKQIAEAKEIQDKLENIANKIKMLLFRGEVEPMPPEEANLTKKDLEVLKIIHRKITPSACPICGESITVCNKCGIDFEKLNDILKRHKAVELWKLNKEAERLEEAFDEYPQDLQARLYQVEKFKQVLEDNENVDFSLIETMSKYPDFETLAYQDKMNKLWEQVQQLPETNFSEEDYVKIEQLHNELAELFSEEKNWKIYEKNLVVLEEAKDKVNNLKVEVVLYKQTHKELKEFATYMTEKVLPMIQEYAASFFMLLTNNKFKTFEITKKFDLLVDGNNIYDYCSGGEQNLANLALRLAISKVLRVLHGSKFDVLILDEISGAFDDERSASVMEQISLLKNYFSIIVVITHKAVDKTFADNVITL